MRATYKTIPHDLERLAGHIAHGNRRRAKPTQRLLERLQVLDGGALEPCKRGRDGIVSDGIGDGVDVGVQVDVSADGGVDGGGDGVAGCGVVGAADGSEGGEEEQEEQWEGGR
jgi:hypothetical protein